MTDLNPEVRGEVVDQTVEVEIEIMAPADAVFDFLVVPEKLLRWMGQDGVLAPRPGGEFRLVVGPDDTAVGQYIEVERPKRVSFSWGWLGSEVVAPGSTTVEITLETNGESTIVHLTHQGLPAGQDAEHLKGWLYHFGQLGQVTAG